MNESIQQKGNRITLQIILFFVIIAGIAFLVQAINEVVTGNKVEAAKTATLPEILLRKNTSGNVVKLKSYAIDIKHRINALPDPEEKEDVHIMVPLRPIGQDANEDIVALFVLQDKAYNCVEYALDAWKDSLINLREGEEMFVELLSLDELPGNVPKVVRANDRVAKKILVFREVKYSRAESVLFIVCSVMGIAAFFIYRRIRVLKERAQINSL